MLWRSAVLVLRHEQSPNRLSELIQRASSRVRDSLFLVPHLPHRAGIDQITREIALIYNSVRPPATSSSSFGLWQENEPHSSKCLSLGETLPTIDVLLPVPDAVTTASRSLTRGEHRFIVPDEVEITWDDQLEEWTDSPVAESVVSSSTDIQPFSFDHVCAGGTFDRLHSGHKLLLSVCALLSIRSVTIGITSNQMLAKKQLSFVRQLFCLLRTNLTLFFWPLHVMVAHRIR